MRTSRTIQGLLACVLSMSVGCGPSATGGGGDDDDDDTTSGGDGGTVVDDGGGSSGYQDNAVYNSGDGGGNGPDASCGAQTQPISVMNLGDPPDMLIVLDRSGSMTTPINPFSFFGPTRWTTMKDALKMVTAARQTQIKFGLSVFPTNNDCEVVNSNKVGINLNTATMIASWLDGNSADGNTPSDAALIAAKTYYDSQPANPAGRYVLFATDGEPTCTATEQSTVDAVKALRMAGIKTFVLGFGNSFGSTGSTMLTNASTEGGVPRAGSPNYYVANDAAQLQSALNTIAGGIVRPSCSYALASAPPVPNDVSVTLDGTLVPRSTMHTDGWDYHPDASTITFFGSACTQVMSGMVTNVSFVYGCPGPKID